MDGVLHAVFNALHSGDGAATAARRPGHHVSAGADAGHPCGICVRPLRWHSAFVGEQWDLAGVYAALWMLACLLKCTCQLK